MAEPTDQDIAEALRLSNPNIRKDAWLATPQEVRDDPNFYCGLLAHARTIAKLRIAEQAMRNIKPYVEWTVSDESPGHHPTMPSAVGAFLDSYAQIKEAGNG